MRIPVTIAVIALLPLAAAAQWHGAAGRMAPMRSPAAMRAAPMARPFMVRPAPMPGRGGFHFHPNVPGVIPQVPQGRAGFHSGHIGFSVGPGFGRFPFGVPPQNRCFSDAFFDPFFCTRRPVRFSSFVPFSYFPYYSLPYAYDYGDNQDYYSDVAAQQMTQANAQASDLTAQIEQLRDEVRQLREQQSSPPVAASPAPRPAEAVKDEPPVPTTLVFRDGRRSQVENYAIVGNTLWIFNDQLRKKIPIADLDLKATQQVNEDHGVDFPLPPAGK